jgi:protein-S-isoprenylcysteine O-methyltransferase Ste14
MAPRPLDRKPWDIPPAYLLGAGALMLILDQLLPLARLVPWPWTLWGVLPILAGIVLAVAAERRFRRAGTPVRPFELSSALVTDGPFRFTRNPMYLGMMLVLGGLALLLGTLAPLLVLPAFFALIHLRFVRLEEAFLELHFGDAYRAYKERVRRWL